MVAIGTPSIEMNIATMAATTFIIRVRKIIRFSLSSFLLPMPRYRSLITIVDMQSKLESAEDMVAQIIAAEISPTMAPGANSLVTAIIALLPFSARPGIWFFIARAARPSSVGNMDIAAMRMADSQEALRAVFSSFAVSKRDTISGPARNVQK